MQCCAPVSYRQKTISNPDGQKEISSSSFPHALPVLLPSSYSVENPCIFLCNEVISEHLSVMQLPTSFIVKEPEILIVKPVFTSFFQLLPHTPLPPRPRSTEELSSSLSLTYNHSTIKKKKSHLPKASIICPLLSVCTLPLVLSLYFMLSFPLPATA